MRPGSHTGYGVKTLPGIREAIEERRWDEANQYMGVVARALNAYSAQFGCAPIGSLMNPESCIVPSLSPDSL